MIAYPVTLTPDEEIGGFVVSFKDIPEAITQGEDLEESLQMAQDALETALDFYFEDNRPVPMPSSAKRGQHLVELPASVSAKVLLLNEMIGQQVRPAELARRLKPHRKRSTASPTCTTPPRSTASPPHSRHSAKRWRCASSSSACYAKLARFTFCRKSSPCISITTHISCSLLLMRSVMRSPSVSSRIALFGPRPSPVPSGGRFA